MQNQPPKAKTEIKGAIVLDDDQAKTSQSEHTKIFPQILVETNTQVQQLNEPELRAQPERKKTSLFKRPLGWLGLGVLVLSVVELVVFIQNTIAESDWLAGAWLLALVVGVTLMIKQVVGHWLSLKKLKRAEILCAKGQTLLNGSSIGQAEDFCEELAQPLMAQYPEQVESWRGHIEPHHMDAEIISLFETQVLQVADKKALSFVTKHASASGAMIAVSPFALLDMVIVLWRNLVMLNQISQCYGLQLNYWGRIRLIKQIFKNMLYAGAAEILSDAGNYALGAGVTGKLSSRLAQGLGAGVLTSRIGLKTIAACRPLPFVESKMPGIGILSKQLLEDLKKTVS